MSKARFRLSGLSDEAGQALDKQILAHLQLDWREIELRSVQGAAFCDWTKTEFKEIQSKLSSTGLHVTTVASRIANWERPITAPIESDLDELKRTAERMRAIGANYVRVMSYPNDGLEEQDWRARVIDRMHQLTAQAYLENIILLHENCAGWGGASYKNTLDLLQHVNHPSLRLLFDIGNGIAYRYDAFEFLKEVWPYVEHVHVKDGMLIDGKAVYTLPGKGHSKVRECLSWLIAHDYKGIYAIEPHLHLIPHLKQKGQEQDLLRSYIQYGEALEELLDQLSKSRIEEGSLQ
ncbi:sugar phosphate isomerase/epimerase family protein [Paenibacillus aquistagni]|uniref:sugar phosphate isomerase/epimerase family protein n=1 Tax=Paenibacillus aquistagni TaxID=1852522 RepID=UPI00145C0A5B|nr:sugar phosphate isomerase/epimerase family protein [Paenibacillus aquistagni]NMM52805.1 sugar phosphate isomerase/epimerase [Paenibacillus aquistagni]